VPYYQAKELPVRIRLAGALPCCFPRSFVPCSGLHLNCLTNPPVFRLAAVNFFLGCVGIVQMSRIAMYKMNKDKGGVTEAIADAKEEVKQTVEVAKEKVTS